MRFVVGFSALLLMLPGFFAFILLALGFLVAIANALASDQNAQVAAMQMIASSALLPLSVLTMLGGGVLFVLLYIEDHAFDLRRVVNDGL